MNKLKLMKRMGYGRADLHSYVSECFMLSETISCFGGSHASQCDGLVFLVGLNRTSETDLFLHLQADSITKSV